MKFRVILHDGQPGYMELVTIGGKNGRKEALGDPSIENLIGALKERGIDIELEWHEYK